MPASLRHVYFLSDGTGTPAGPSTTPVPSTAFDDDRLTVARGLPIAGRTKPELPQQH
ncbi:hypothetical protein NHF46_01095 [Arthrobacter alpinus]|nr:hypothetical protein [Arthrobacter alpinus]